MRVVIHKKNGEMKLWFMRSRTKMSDFVFRLSYFLLYVHEISDFQIFISPIFFFFSNFSFWFVLFSLYFTLFEIFIFCPTIQLWFPEKNCWFFGWKTRENFVVLDILAVDNFDFTRKIVKKKLGEKLVETLGVSFWTKIWILE